MKDYFIGKFNNNNVVEFAREYINEKDIWYVLTLGIEGKPSKLRMHNNKIGVWRIMGTRIPRSVLKLEEEFNEVIRKNEGFVSDVATRGFKVN